MTTWPTLAELDAMRATGTEYVLVAARPAPDDIADAYWCYSRNIDALGARTLIDLRVRPAPLPEATLCQKMREMEVWERTPAPEIAQLYGVASGLPAAAQQQAVNAKYRAALNEAAAKQGWKQVGPTVPVKCRYEEPPTSMIGRARNAMAALKQRLDDGERLCDIDLNTDTVLIEDPPGTLRKVTMLELVEAGGVRLAGMNYEPPKGPLASHLEGLSAAVATFRTWDDIPTATKSAPPSPVQIDRGVVAGLVRVYGLATVLRWVAEAAEPAMSEREAGFRIESRARVYNHEGRFVAEPWVPAPLAEPFESDDAAARWAFHTYASDRRGEDWRIVLVTSDGKREVVG